MQRHWEGVHVRDDGQIWPPSEKKKIVRKTTSSETVHSRSAEFGDLLRFFSTLDVDLQKLLLEAVASRKHLMQERKASLACEFDHRTGAVEEYWPMPRDTQDGVCRNVAIQTRRSRQQSSELNLKSRDRSREISKSFVGHLSQTSSRQAHSEEDTEKNLREQTTVNVLQRWAEPLEQYLSNLQKFEEELREKWLTPNERQTSTSGAHKGDSKSTCMTSETQMTRSSSDKVETLSNRKYGGAPSRSHLTDHDKSEQENYEPSDLHFRKPRPKHSPYESESLPGQKYLAAEFRSQKLVEWWPITAKPLQTTKPRSAPSRPQLYTAYDPRILPDKAKRDSGEKTRQKPEWWPALRRPYSASEIKAMHEKDSDKATRKPSVKIATGYPLRRQKPPQKTAVTTENHCTQACIAEQDDDSPKRTLQIRNASPPLRKNHREEHRKKMDELQKVYGQSQKRDKPRKLRQEQVTISKCKTGHGEIHALRGHHDQFQMQGPTTITIKEHVCGIIAHHVESSHLKDQVCGIMTQFQPKQELEVASYLLHQIETKRNQAGDHSAQPEFPKVIPVVEVHNEEHQDKNTRIKKNRSNSYLQRGIERFADKLIDQAVNEVASELAEFCETVADQMYMAEFMT